MEASKVVMEASEVRLFLFQRALNMTIELPLLKKKNRPQLTAPKDAQADRRMLL